jgi:hypothetical protein
LVAANAVSDRVYSTDNLTDGAPVEAQALDRKIDNFLTARAHPWYCFS